MMVYVRYLLSLLKHKWFVFVAGLRFRYELGMGLSLWMLLIHDWSKFTPFQFYAYSHQFQGGGCDKFPMAWERHYRTEPHHPEAWVMKCPSYSDGLIKDCFIVPVRMDELDIREMIIDWMGASRTYTGSWNMQSWLDRELTKKPFSDETLKRTKEILVELGYKVG